MIMTYLQVVNKLACDFKAPWTIICLVILCTQVDPSWESLQKLSSLMWHVNFNILNLINYFLKYSLQKYLFLNSHTHTHTHTCIFIFNFSVFCSVDFHISNFTVNSPHSSATTHILTCWPWANLIFLTLCISLFSSFYVTSLQLRFPSSVMLLYPMSA